MRIVVIVMLLAIIASLFSALLFLFKSGPGSSERMVRALTLRVGLSVTLFIVLMVAYRFGWIGARL